MSIKDNTISLWAAVIININIIIGTGIFINTIELSKRTGLLGGLCYALVGLLLFPLILSFVKLLELYPEGGFYTYCSSIHPIAGFFNTWCYFFSKLSSASLSIHIFTVLIQKIFPILSSINTFAGDLFVLIILLGLNMLNVRTGSKIQSWVMILKLFPIFFVIAIGSFFFQTSNTHNIHQLWDGIPSAIPLVLHALLGFEIACSISRNIENPRINAPRAILISYSVVIILYFLYQTLFYAVVGSDLMAQANYSTAFPLLIGHFTQNTHCINFLSHLIHCAIALSALSAAFGVIYANIWNLYSLAELNYVPLRDIVMKRNRFNIPFICVIMQGVIIITYMVIMCGKETTFQQLSAFGAVITYGLSISGLMVAYLKNNKSILIPVLGLLNCAILLSVSLYAMYNTNNFIPLYLFTGIIFFGIMIYMIKNSYRKRDTIT